MKFVQLAPHEPRCAPWLRDRSPLRDTCARALAAGLKQDLSGHFVIYAGLAPYCPSYLSVERAAAEAGRKPVKDWPEVSE